MSMKKVPKTWQWYHGITKGKEMALEALHTEIVACCADNRPFTYKDFKAVKEELLSNKKNWQCKECGTTDYCPYIDECCPKCGSTKGLIFT